MTARPSKAQAWVPERQEVIWIDCNPQAGREMRDLHPFLVLSPRTFNEHTSLVLGLPMTTAAYNASNPFAVQVGAATGRKREADSFVLCHQPKSFDWRARAAAPHKTMRVSDEAFAQVLLILNQIVQLA